MPTTLPPAAQKLADADLALAKRWRVLDTLYWNSTWREYAKALPKLLTTSTKTIKSLAVRAETGIMYLSPSTESGINMCPLASAGCAAACLGHSSGQMVFSTSKRARILRTWAWEFHTGHVIDVLSNEIRNLEVRARNKGNRPFVRLNGTSDVVRSEAWAQQHPRVQFYDYTKLPKRALNFARGNYPPNYHVTFSRSENNDADCLAVLKARGNVAMVFYGTLPPRVSWCQFEGFCRTTVANVRSPAVQPPTWDVINGDETDARPDDRHGVVVGLTTKGPLARKDKSGFVIR